MRTRPIFLYDADCAACSRFRRLAAFLDPSHAVDFVSISDAGASGLLSSLPQSQWYACSRLIDESGKMTSGGDAMITLFGYLAAGRNAPWLVARLSFATPASRWLYGVISRLHGSSCSLGEGSVRHSSRLSVAWSA